MTFRSGFEKRIAKQLEDNGIPFEYERESFNYYNKLRGECHECGGKEVYSNHWYTPDFFLNYDVGGQGFETILEVKGKFSAKDRKKMVAMKELHPELDLRMVFMRDNKIHRMSQTRYSQWAEQEGYPYCVGEIPADWIKEFKDEEVTS